MKKFIPPISQTIILIFIVIMFILALMNDMETTELFNGLINRTTMNGLLAVSILPMLNSGVGINFGLPIGAVAGLLGMVLTIQFGFIGLFGFLIAVAFALLIGWIFGFGYAVLLERVKEQEEIASTFIGFSFVSLMSLFWAVAPFDNPQMVWPIGGYGLRPTIGLQNFFGKALTKLWNFDLWGISFPLGLLLFCFIICFLLWLFFKSRTGIALKALGESELFVRLSGLNIIKLMRTAVILSTILAAVGMCVYAQSYGFVELYEAPLMMAFPAASAVLLGGSNGKKVTFPQLFAGILLYQTIYLLSAPVANLMLAPESAEIMRMIITNAIILYAIFQGSYKPTNQNKKPV